MEKDNYRYNYSFVIPHHNSLKELLRCIDSIPVRNDIEIIVVDDNSDISEKPKALRPDVKIIYLDANQSKGAGRARNVGLDNAQGKWIVFADCDDFYEKNFIRDFDVFLDSSYDIVYFDMYYSIDLETGKCWDNPYSGFLNDFLSNQKSQYAINSVKYSRTEPWHQFYSHNFLKSIDVHFHEVPSCNDAWFTQFSASQTNNIYAINKKLYYWVRNSNSLTNKKHTLSFFKLKENELSIIKHLKAKENAWNTMAPFWQGLGRIAKNNGLKLAFQILFLRLRNGNIEWKIVWHKFFKK